MGALNGYKILDFSTLLPGPYATMVLADLGAEVLKISGKDKHDLVVHWPPVLAGATVTAKVEKNGKSAKVRVYKMKPKKGYRRTQGHRQPYTKLTVEAINA